ncbi:MAG: uracil phosphoribosyltransferase [Bacteroidota bacterium]
MASKLHVIGNQHSYLNQWLYELRDQHLQQDRMRFRLNLERVGEVLAYEMSKQFSYTETQVSTPLGKLEMPLLEEQPVVVSIMRAGVPFHQGFLSFLDRADNGFVSAYRHHTSENEFIVKVEYMAVPDLAGRTVMLIDPMIATGKSIVLTYKALETHGIPDKVFIGGVVASEEGIEYIQQRIPQAEVYVGAMDGELTAKSYIVPGLGDAGDLAFGPK